MSATAFAAQAWQKMLSGQNYIVIGALKDKITLDRIGLPAAPFGFNRAWL